jgi:hypothetical protein
MTARYDSIDDVLRHASPDVRTMNHRDTPKRSRRSVTDPQEHPARLHEAQHHEAWNTALARYGADLPEAQREYAFLQPWRNHRFDYAWPEHLVAVELDGGQWHAGGGRHNTDEDRFKLNSAAALGWRVLRFSGTALNEDPAGCVVLLRRALER